MSKQVIISVLSKDRPGIIAEVTNAIYELDGDLADLSQSVLRGYFNMTVIARFAKDMQLTRILDKIRSMNPEAELELSAKEIPRDAADQPLPEMEHTYIVTAQGQNRTGLVAAIATFCRDNAINILDYDTKLENDIYSMMLEIDLTKSGPVDEIHKALEVLAEEVGLKIVMQNKKLFETINEITLT